MRRPTPTRRAHPVQLPNEHQKLPAGQARAERATAAPRSAPRVVTLSSQVADTDVTRSTATVGVVNDHEPTRPDNIVSSGRRSSAATGVRLRPQRSDASGRALSPGGLVAQRRSGSTGFAAVSALEPMSPSPSPSPSRFLASCYEKNPTTSITSTIRPSTLRNGLLPRSSSSAAQTTKAPRPT
jgi:hypothetical protein